MSLRQIAKELGISPAYLSYMLNGKRPWRKDLYQRYMGVVNTFVNSGDAGVNSQTKSPPQVTVSLGVKEFGAGRGTRTHTPAKVADFKSAASTIPPSRLFKVALHRITFRARWLLESELRSRGGGGDGRIRTAE